MTLGSTSVRSQDGASRILACALNPKCELPKFRGSPPTVRGVVIESGAKDGPRSINLYVNFAFDSADLDQDSKITLDQLGPALRDPALAPYSLTIAGHTDGKGTAEYNQALSERRATTVRRYLVDRGWVEDAKLASVGYGKSRLLDPTRPEDGVNRRVQISTNAETQ